LLITFALLACGLIVLGNNAKAVNSFCRGTGFEKGGKFVGELVCFSVEETVFEKRVRYLPIACEGFPIVSCRENGLVVDLNVSKRVIPDFNF
jgi:hypothetical protein